MSLSAIRIAGILISIIGFLSLLIFLSTPVNPDVIVGNLGLLAIVLGALVVSSDLFAKRVRLTGTATLLAVAGWSVFAAGLVVGVAGFLLANQVLCSCPAYGSCVCGVPLYNLMLSGGPLIAVAGAAVIVSSVLFARRPPLKAQMSLGGPRIGSRGITLAVIALTGVVTFAGFSYYPGVYVTSVNEETQFLNGMPIFVDSQHSGSPPLITSPMTQSTSGFQLAIGGTLVYILRFNSVPSYQTYRIGKISIGEGFTLSEANVTIPMIISPKNSSVSITFSVRAPYYPYYGPVSFVLTMEKLNDTKKS